MTVYGILFDYTGILMSGLSMLCLLLFVNIFVGSYLAYQVHNIHMYMHVYFMQLYSYVDNVHFPLHY